MSDLVGELPEFRNNNEIGILFRTLLLKNTNLVINE